jgi:hypothetical protein
MDLALALSTLTGRYNEARKEGQKCSGLPRARHRTLTPNTPTSGGTLPAEPFPITGRLLSVPVPPPIAVGEQSFV